MNHVMIALIPITHDWCQIELPHLTLVYSGRTSDHDLIDHNRMVDQAKSMAMSYGPLTLSVTGIEVLGPDDDQVDVLTLQLTPGLAAMRQEVVHWNRSEFKTFKPHVTIGPHPSKILNKPSAIAFNKILVGWGEHRNVFLLNP